LTFSSNQGLHPLRTCILHQTSLKTLKGEIHQIDTKAMAVPLRARHPHLWLPMVVLFLVYQTNRQSKIPRAAQALVQTLLYLW
jgi:hypothetical protein